MLKLFKKLFRKKVRPNRTPIYTMGFADPVIILSDDGEASGPWHFCYLGGLDFRVKIDGEYNNLIQGVSLTSTGGTLIIYNSPGNKETAKLLIDSSQIFKLEICGNNEYGYKEITTRNIKILDFRFGVAVDDVVVETIIDFEIVK
jgi:hypothetical protein